jgi:hypothetical protein
MQYLLCRHIRTNGSQCKSPALSSGDWCYFHDRLHQRHSGFRYTAATRGYLIPGQHIELAPLEDRESVQVALSLVINALASGKLETRRATALLYGLQLASSNAVSLNLRPYAPNVVRAVQSTPDGLDLAEPTHYLELTEEEEDNGGEDDHSSDVEQPSPSS